MIESKTTHITPVGGNIFLDLGFPPDEAAKLKDDSDMLIKTKLTCTDNIIADDNDAEWEDIPSEATEFDDVTIPHDVVKIMSEREVSAIAAWRIYRGLTQAQAAEKAGISQAALSQIEKAGTRPQAKTREQFAAIYDCRPEQLVL